MIKIQASARLKATEVLAAESPAEIYAAVVDALEVAGIQFQKQGRQAIKFANGKVNDVHKALKTIPDLKYKGAVQAQTDLYEYTMSGGQRGQVKIMRAINSIYFE